MITAVGGDISHTICQFVEEIVAGNFQGLRYIQGFMGAAGAGIDPTTGIRNAGACKESFICDSSFW